MRNGRGEITMEINKNLREQWQMGVIFSRRKERKPQPKERKSVMAKERQRWQMGENNGKEQWKRGN